MKRRISQTGQADRQPSASGSGSPRPRIDASLERCRQDYQREQARPKRPRRHFWDDLT